MSHVWDEWISPESIIDLVRNTAPFLPKLPVEDKPLVELGGGAQGYLRILSSAPAALAREQSPEEQLQSYFAVCIAAHHATVATFVPTDVDTKIRGLIWRKIRDPLILRPLVDLSIQMGEWSLDGISTRWTTLDETGPVSGHNGEWLSVMCAGLGRALKVGDADSAAKCEEAIDAELKREAAVFMKSIRKPGMELDALRIAASVTHNLGDVDQAISFWTQEEMTTAARARFNRLAHENSKPYGGALQISAGLYRDAMSAEGHRHYPLRHVKALRRSPDLLLPLGPFFDDWGATLGTHPSLSLMERVEVLDEMVRGCRKIAGQQGYYRAIAGFMNAAGRTFQQTAEQLPTAARKDLKDSGFQKLIAVPRVSFESMMKKKVAPLIKK